MRQGDQVCMRSRYMWQQHAGGPLLCMLYLGIGSMEDNAHNKTKQTEETPPEQNDDPAGQDKAHNS